MGEIRPDQTRHEPVVKPAEADPTATRREDLGPAERADEVRLSGRLAERFTRLRELPSAGAEADMLHVRDADGRELVLKLYRRGVVPDGKMWRGLAVVRSPRVVRLLETGNADGRAFEVMEYLPGGTLREYIEERGTALETPAVVRVAAQIAEGLAALHAAKVIHQDLKPENVLVRSREPLELALADFGSSRYLDQSAMFTSAGHTLAYTAPETFAGMVSPSRDWWSLGIIVRELALGERPFAGMLPEAVMLHLASRPVDTARVEDARLRLLCRGLLVRDPQDRWGADEFAEWSTGGSPAVRESSAPLLDKDAVKPFLFRERVYEDRAELAAAMAEHWEETVRRFFARPGQALETLRAWLLQFDDPRNDDVAGRDEVIDLFGGPAPGDVQLMMLLRWLDGELPPVYAGSRLTPVDLPGLARRAVGGEARAGRVVSELLPHRVLDVLDGAPGGSGLAEIAERWREAARRWRLDAAGIVRTWPALAGTLEHVDPEAAPEVAARLLLACLDPRAAGEELRAEIIAGRSRMPVRVDWFETLLVAAGSDPLRLLAVRQAVPVAADEARRTRSAIDQGRARQAERTARWQQLEAERLAGRAAAYGAVAGGTGIMGGIWVVFLFGANFFTFRYAGLVMIFTMAVLAFQCACEATLAHQIGSLYHPQYSLLQRVSVLVGRAGATMRSAGGCGGCLLVFATLCATGLLTAVFPLSVPLAVAVGHAVWAIIRLSSWNRQRQDAMNRILGGHA
ncbi:serine/threonine-protein kinase [Actinomadura fibrosa]|uniref:Serine/threonine-protein kinase n=1 Tax=Actinomadura fibrosa TaxID=111802 RepID=A0ABW2XCG4_9ACTN|nr:protein kinase [Actinomadura fibrosa]